ncbi:hypothetical protein ABB37_04663 [Leptomonas pyrrhocoris]|uniref:Uncharacterized protein n=1 Tax=Leptomonas pyrrhocoris TaxID=157538 RepID=A0A0M9G1E9_LEPPY|nr:hypothetical protein ABB37_04663 [Leptomonas pyrrhocoris]KPA80430.1 hypothetical protein ABB37_04663 [Leptomonas pyrrhocoris]|eukprot:XP_015658869.1 hypothetical protein ABB37_04663 [Leptomonas pyrrhocoris]
MSSAKAAVPVCCSRCGKVLGNARKSTDIQCLKCKKWYHKKCFMAETGSDTDKNSRTSQSCVCCLSTPTGEARLMRSGRGNKYAKEFLKNGFCVVLLGNNEEERKHLDAELAKWGAEAVKYFHALLKTYECQSEFNTSVPTLESGYSNFRQRCPGRFEIIADFISNKVVPLVEKSKAVQETLDFLLCNPKMKVGKKIMSSGCFLSMMGSETQNYHTDGPALSDVVDLFPYAVNVFVPLVPVDSHNGTEFIPGSHNVGVDGKAKSVRPSVAVGNALLFDYRVIHRGLRNSKLDPRPCFYATYSQSWYKDTYNFSESRYKRKLEVSTQYLEPRDERMAKRNKIEIA